MLKSCVSRSIIARTGSCAAADRDRARADGRRADRQAPAAAARPALRAPCPPPSQRRRARASRAGSPPPARIAPSRAAAARPASSLSACAVEQRRVIPRRFRQHDVQVDVGRPFGMRDRDLVTASARPLVSVARAAANSRATSSSSLSRKYGSGTPSQSGPSACSRARDRARASPSSIAWNSSAASPTCSASGPT